ncbi:MAG: alpha/beta fold hydrolase [Acidobacteriaceae bacterium]
MTGECKGSLTSFVLEGKALEVLLCEPPSAQQTIVLLHEALGSVSYWKDFPEKLAASTGCRVVAYSRAGHGSSQGPVEPRNPHYYRNQVERVLPTLFARFAVSAPILYGHSEGAGIALLYAAEQPQKVHAVVAEAPIVVPEVRAQDRIQELTAPDISAELIRKLARYHTNPDTVFQSWIADVTSPQMLQFPLDSYLPKIVCPVLVLQGSEDEFGGSGQLQTIRRYLPTAQCEVLSGAGHLLHRDSQDLVIEKVRIFLTDRSILRKQEAVGPNLVRTQE